MCCNWAADGSFSNWGNPCSNGIYGRTYFRWTLQPRCFSRRFSSIVEKVAEELVSVEDAQLLLAKCLRENGYDITDPKNDQSLQSVLRPVFLAADQKGREELFETIQTCADENNIPLGGTAEFENPEEVADTLDTELEFAQCLRGKGIEVEDPNTEKPLRSILVGLVQSGQYLEDQIRASAEECFDDLGIEPPQQGGG